MNFLHIKWTRIKKSSIMFGGLYAAVEVSQFIISAITIRFGVFLVSLPDDHKLHATFINVLCKSLHTVCLDTCVIAIVRPTLTTLLAVSVGIRLGHSMCKYFNVNTALKSVFSLIYQNSMLDSSRSTSGVFQVRIVYSNIN